MTTLMRIMTKKPDPDWTGLIILIPLGILFLIGLLRFIFS